MAEAKCYTVMELAEKVGVPRTTINDWLGKYSTYIGFVMQGKRRVYTETTLSVLLKVSELRAAMKSSFEIEQELAAIYAIHPEFAEEVVEEQPAAQDDNTGLNETVTETLPQPMNPQISAEEYALAVKQQTDELTSLLGERFRDILTKMDDIEDNAKKNGTRAKLFSLLTILLILNTCTHSYTQTPTYAHIYTHTQAHTHTLVWKSTTLGCLGPRSLLLWIRCTLSLPDSPLSSPSGFSLQRRSLGVGGA